MSARAVRIEGGPRRGCVTAPRSKSHEHRLLIASFLSGDYTHLSPCEGDADDILATKRCLLELSEDGDAPVLDCGESGSTRRFLSPIASALGKRPVFKTAGRLAERPQADYGELKSGLFTLDGDVSSQFVTALLFALPILKGDSSIRFSTHLESRGYVDMTLRVLSESGIVVSERSDGFDIPGSQKYKKIKNYIVEGDWSGAAFWYAMNCLGGEVKVQGLDDKSAQPDKVVCALLKKICEVNGASSLEVDVSECPDLFPVLCVVAAAQRREVVFSGIKRLRYKESNRVSAMAGVLGRLGVATREEETFFKVFGKGEMFRPCEIATLSDHRIAMASAVAATFASGEIILDDAACAAKSYPAFFDEFFKLQKI